MRYFPSHAGEGIGVGSVILITQTEVGSVISITQIEGHKKMSCVDKTLTPPLPLPYRGGESLAVLLPSGRSGGGFATSWRT